jgi:hypothetical protein
MNRQALCKVYLKNDQTIAQIGIEIVHMGVHAQTVDEISIGLLLSRLFDHWTNVDHLFCRKIQVRKGVEEIGHETKRTALGRQ